MAQEQSINTSPSWKERVKKYLKENFTKNHNLWRLLWFVAGCVIVLIPSLTCNILFRHHELPWINNYDDSQYHNPGISFGTEMSPAMIYFLQAAICVILLGVILFMKNWYYVLLLALAFAGGAFNLIDRAIGYPGFANTVIDYIPTLWFFNTISNFPDFFILGGVIIFALLYIVLTIVGVSNSGRKSKKDSNEQTQSPKP